MSRSSTCMHLLITDTWQSKWDGMDGNWQGNKKLFSGRKCLWPTRMIDLDRWLCPAVWSPSTIFVVVASGRWEYGLIFWWAHSLMNHYETDRHIMCVYVHMQPFLDISILLVCTNNNLSISFSLFNLHCHHQNTLATLAPRFFYKKLPIDTYISKKIKMYKN